VARDTRTQKLIYHLTALANLSSILNHGLKPRHDLRSFGHIDVADPEVIKKRQAIGLLNHVPFHFFAKTPFAWSAMESKPNEEFVYISLKRDVARKRGYKILTKHPLSGNLEN
jgi:ssDNA thymidine ADP-ribosyltransferase, DarT